MAKRDISRNGKVFIETYRYRRSCFDKTMNQIECASRKKNQKQNGIRKIVIDAYKENGYIGAMIALKTYNDRVKRSNKNKDQSELNLYSISQMKQWILEYEEKNKGDNTLNGETR